jgi:RNA polymerase sigma-70 factor (ECF subfamily)
LGVPESDLDDLLHEVFLVVHKRLDDYQEEGRARSWLYSICVRVAHGQRRKSQRLSAEPAPREQSVPPSQLEHVQDRESLALGLRLLEALPPEQREVFVLYEVEDMPMSEIAQAVGSPLQTVYSRLYKARERILLALQKQASACEP